MPLWLGRVNAMQIRVEVAYAAEKELFLISLLVKKETIVMEAIALSGILELELLKTGEINTLKDRIGIFGKIVSLKTVLKDGDRVEIYQDLIQDPKEARRIKAGITKKLQKNQQASSSKKR